MDTIIDNTSVRSPSSRRAWIEIIDQQAEIDSYLVALLAEGVDRNFYLRFVCQWLPGRPPRGGRG